MREHLEFEPLKDRLELVSESIKGIAPDFDIRVGRIDPQYMNGAALADHYDVNLEDGANCVVVRGKRGDTKTTAAIVVPVGYRADLNGIVCEKLDAKRVSMAPLEEVLQETGMEYGSITPVGLPENYRILIDSRLMEKEKIIVGAGKQIAKLLVPTRYFTALPNVEVVEELAKPS